MKNNEEATRAALLHDFYINEDLTGNGAQRLGRHPQVALENSLKHYDLNDARSAADYEYDQSLKRLRILLAADDYIFNKYSNQELDKMIKIYPNRQETIYYQNLREQ